MNPQMRAKLEHLIERREEINALLSDPTVIATQNTFRDLSIELADISPVAEHFERYQALDAELTETRDMLEDDDPSIRRLSPPTSPLRASHPPLHEQLCNGLRCSHLGRNTMHVPPLCSYTCRTLGTELDRRRNLLQACAALRW